MNPLLGRSIPLLYLILEACGRRLLNLPNATSDEFWRTNFDICRILHPFMQDRSLLKFSTCNTPPWCCIRALSLNPCSFSDPTLLLFSARTRSLNVQGLTQQKVGISDSAVSTFLAQMVVRIPQHSSAPSQVASTDETVAEERHGPHQERNHPSRKMASRAHRRPSPRRWRPRQSSYSSNVIQHRQVTHCRARRAPLSSSLILPIFHTLLQALALFVPRTKVGGMFNVPLPQYFKGLSRLPGHELASRTANQQARCYRPPKSRGFRRCFAFRLATRFR